MSATRFSAFRLRSAALAAALAITATACGGSDSSTDTTTASSEAMTDSTEAMTDSTEASGSDTTAGHSGEAMIDGSTLWKSADGKVSMEIDPTWTDSGGAGVVAGTWMIGTTGANVTVVDQAGVEGGLQEYLDTAVTELPQVGTFTVVESGVRPGPHGSDIGVLEYTGEASAAAGVAVHIIQVLSVANGHAAVATFSTLETDYASIIDSVQPYIETIQAL